MEKLQITSNDILKDKSELEELLNKDDVDIIVSAISGFAGLESTIIAAKTGKTILNIILPLNEELN